MANAGYYSPTTDGTSSVALPLNCLFIIVNSFIHLSFLACSGFYCAILNPSAFSINGTVLSGTNSTAISCSNLLLTEVNCNIMVTATILSLRDNSIAAVPANAFSTLSALTYLFASFRVDVLTLTLSVCFTIIPLLTSLRTHFRGFYR